MSLMYQEPCTICYAVFNIKKYIIYYAIIQYICYMQISFNPQNLPVRELMLNNLYKVTNLILKKSGMEPRAVCLQKLYIIPSTR